MRPFTLYSCIFCIFVALFSHWCSAAEYKNPVVDANCPDPGVLYVPEDGYFYAVTTSNLPNTPQIFPIRVSKDLVNWKVIGSVFDLNSTNRPIWGKSDFWAPEIHFVNDSYRIYYTARDATGVLCIGVVMSRTPGGHWTEGSPAPIVRDPDVGSIDATFFLDQSVTPHQPYLIWKEDGNGLNPPRPTPIWAQSLRPDGLRLAPGSSRTELIRNTLPWEGQLVEGPWILANAPSPYLYLLYSANAYYNASYAMGVARSSSGILGPWEKLETPLVHSNSKWIGPGHCSAVWLPWAPSRSYLLYHSWLEGEVGGDNSRVLMLDELRWEPRTAWPYVVDNEPSIEPQPYP